MYFDHFNNAVVDLKTRAGNGTITEPAGTQLRLYCPTGVDCQITTGNCPIAYRLPAPDSPTQKINGPWRFDLKFDNLVNGNNAVLGGLLLWQGAVGDMAGNPYGYEFGYYPNEGAVVISLWLGSWSGSRLYTAAKTKPNGTTPHVYRIYVNPLDRSVYLPDVSAYIGANQIKFAYSTDNGATFTDAHTRTIDLSIDWAGPVLRKTDTGTTVTQEALFDFYAVTAYAWDSKLLAYVPSIPAGPDGLTPSPQNAAGMLDEVELTRGAGGRSIQNIDRGALLPGPNVENNDSNYVPVLSGLQDGYDILTNPSDTRRAMVGSLQDADTGGRPAANKVLDEIVLLEQRGARFYSALEFSTGALLDGSRQGNGLEDEIFYDLEQADYQDDKLDGDGKELLYSSSNVEAALLIDTTLGTFGNPATGHYGAAKDGKHYFNGVECGASNLSFGTVAGGPNRLAWPWWSGSGPFGKDIPAANTISIPSDGVVRMTGTAMSDLNGGVIVSGRSGWYLTGDFDVTVDFSNTTQSGGNDGGLLLMIGTDPYNLMYVRRRYNGQYDKNVHINNAGQSYATNATVHASGKLRLTRSGTSCSAYFWTGSAWTQIGSSYSHANMAGAMYVQLSLFGNGSLTMSIDLSNFTIVSGATSNRAMWYSETSGTHRGLLQSMPDKLAAIATQGSVDLIDSDTNKLWMRFVKTSENAVHHFSSLGQYVRDLSWSNGTLVLAHASSPTGSEEGGTIIIDFSTELIRMAREAASTACGSTYATTNSFNTYAWTPSPRGIFRRNDNLGYESDRDDWRVPDYRVYSTALRHSGVDEYIASGTLLGLMIHRTRRWYLSQTGRDFNWPRRSQSTESGQIRSCRFKSDDTIFYTDGTNLYSRNKTNGSTGWADVADGGTFTAETSKALPGTRSFNSQYRFLLYGNYVFIPAVEGVYRVDWPSGSWELFYGVGGTHDILPSYNRVVSIGLGNDGVEDLLIVGIETLSVSQVVVVKLGTNVVYGVSVPKAPTKSSSAVAA